MRPEAVATIAVRLLGLTLILYILRPAANSASELAMGLINTRGWGSLSGVQFMRLLSPAAVLVLLGLGMYMFLSGKWFIRRIVRGLGPAPEGICPACGYDLRGLRVSRCPECGEKLPKGVVTAATSKAPGRPAPTPPTPAGGDS